MWFTLDNNYRMEWRYKPPPREGVVVLELVLKFVHDVPSSSNDISK